MKTIVNWEYLTKDKLDEVQKRFFFAQEKRGFFIILIKDPGD